MMVNSLSWKTLQRKKLTITFFSAAFIGVIYVIHQFLSVNQIEFYANSHLNNMKDSTVVSHVLQHQKVTSSVRLNGVKLKHSWILENEGEVRGIRLSHRHLYSPNSRGNFVCFTSRKEIPIYRINDDYCDCPLDGSDEPGTSACYNGIFHCRTRNEVSVPSGRVNDGICDCCDGSDEWLNITLQASLNVNRQKKLGIFLSPCVDSCS
ncbi:hypothetical protein J437_LFUL017984 [Ladona fulva]|uniref:Glucosidase II beta subunit N-terminal domain-containing protein n=1 Tax=Ladona fulva TaxID=123851 RepID=A0A8K0KQX7_LADFU|nr:hypothetical protein J437_LFUL017984 [Ladona fulva]